jgi:hypothetical protein
MGEPPRYPVDEAPVEIGELAYDRVAPVVWPDEYALRGVVGNFSVAARMIWGSIMVGAVAVPWAEPIMSFAGIDAVWLPAGGE